MPDREESEKVVVRSRRSTPTSTVPEVLPTFSKDQNYGTMSSTTDQDNDIEKNDTHHYHRPVSNLVPGGSFATSNIIVRMLYQLAIAMKTPCWNCLDSLVASFIIRKSPQLYQPTLLCGRDVSLCLLIVKSFLLILLIVVFLPFALISMLLLLPLQLFRPRSYSLISPHPHNPHKQARSSHAPSGSYTEFDSDLPNQDLPLIRSSRSSLNLMTSTAQRHHHHYTVVTANLCLMPKFVAHVNNLQTSLVRSKHIASYFIDGIISKLAANVSLNNASSQPPPPPSLAANVVDEAAVGTMHGGGHNNLMLANPYPISTENLNEELVGTDDNDEVESVSTLWSVTSKEKVVSDVLVTPADFICLQEVFDKRSSSKLLEGLKSRYPYIVYDVSWPVHDKLITLLGSGLVIASRYKLIDVSFRAFKDGHRDDKLACKGLLMTKIYLGKTADGRCDMIGYLSNTHLQAWSNQGASKARCKQLESIDKWIGEFMRRSAVRKAGGREKVVFNIIAGDFNFDRVSYYDLNEQKCEILKNYKDPCMDEQGHPFNWVIGTELVQNRLHDDNVKTPTRLHKMLISELERSQFVASTQPTKPHHHTTNSSTSTASATSTANNINHKCEDGKRKIDYILYRDCPQVKTTVKDFKFYTGLTTLTDHLPIGMSFVCEPQ